MDRGTKLRIGGRSRFHQSIIVVMIIAMLEFALQATYIQPSANAVDSKGDSHHVHTASGLPFQGRMNTRIVSHVHADGTVHRHAVEGGKGAIEDHLRESGSPC